MSRTAKRGVVLGLVILLVIGAIFGIARVGASAESSVCPYPTNKNGLTYGPLAFSADGKTPDLVAVEGENRVTGYVYYTDLQAAEGGEVANPTEAVAYMQEREAASTKALAEELNKAQGTEASTVTEEQVRDYLDILGGGGSFDRCVKRFAEDASLSESTAENIFNEAFEQAERKACAFIPIYDVDGEKVLGEFKVGSLY